MQTDQQTQLKLNLETYAVETYLGKDGYWEDPPPRPAISITDVLALEIDQGNALDMIHLSLEWHNDLDQGFYERVMDIKADGEGRWLLLLSGKSSGVITHRLYVGTDRVFYIHADTPQEMLLWTAWLAECKKRQAVEDGHAH